MSLVNNVLNYNQPSMSAFEEAINRSIIYNFKPQYDNNPFILEQDRSNVSQQLTAQTVGRVKLSDADKFKYYELARQELEIMRFVSDQTRSQIIDYCFTFRRELFKMYMSQYDVYEVCYRKQKMVILPNTKDRNGYFNVVYCDHKHLLDVYHTAIYIVKLLHREELEELSADFSD